MQNSVSTSSTGPRKFSQAAYVATRPAVTAVCSLLSQLGHTRIDDGSENMSTDATLETPWGETWELEVEQRLGSDVDFEAQEKAHREFNKIWSGDWEWHLLRRRTRHPWRAIAVTNPDCSKVIIWRRENLKKHLNYYVQLNTGCEAHEVPMSAGTRFIQVGSVWQKYDPANLDLVMSVAPKGKGIWANN